MILTFYKLVIIIVVLADIKHLKERNYSYKEVLQLAKSKILILYPFFLEAKGRMKLKLIMSSDMRLL